jgi:hypothetical protein
VCSPSNTSMTLVSLDSLNLNFSNRLVRTRMPGGVGGAQPRAAPYPNQGWAAREAGKRGFEKVITYTMDDESATILKAVGWTAEATTKGRSWSAPSRIREDKTPTVNKVRWACQTKPAKKNRAQGPVLSLP